MGIELVIGVAALAIGVISGINQMNSAHETTVATEKAVVKEQESVAAQKEVTAIQLAQQKIVGVEDRRQRVREERVRRAAMLSASQSVGGAGSSSESGGVSALGTNLGGLIAQQESQSKGNAGINDFNQKALDLSTEGSAIMARARARGGEADAFSSFLGVFSTGLGAFGKS